MEKSPSHTVMQIKRASNKYQGSQKQIKWPKLNQIKSKFWSGCMKLYIYQIQQQKITSILIFRLKREKIFCLGLSVILADLEYMHNSV